MTGLSLDTFTVLHSFRFNSSGLLPVQSKYYECPECGGAVTRSAGWFWSCSSCGWQA